jgi:Sigma-70, non-essential region
VVEIAGLHFQQDRISDLVAEVDTEAQSLRSTERELLRLAEGSGIARAEVIDRLFGREIDPDWIGEATPSDRGWCALMQTHAQRLAELRADFEAVPRRLGLPLSELRHRSQGAKGLIAPCDVSWPCWLTAPLASIVKDGGFGNTTASCIRSTRPSCVPTATLCIRFRTTPKYASVLPHSGLPFESGAISIA